MVRHARITKSEAPVLMAITFISTILKPDKDKNHTQPVFQMTKESHHTLKHKIERPQAQNGKDIG